MVLRRSRFNDDLVFSNAGSASTSRSELSLPVSGTERHHHQRHGGAGAEGKTYIPARARRRIDHSRRDSGFDELKPIIPLLPIPPKLLFVRAIGFRPRRKLSG